jgi:DNA-directed RNA polymerase subunit RPC12/RpoP
MECAHYNVCRALDNGDDYIKEDCAEYLEFLQNNAWGKWVISEVRCPECLEYFDPESFSKEEMNKCPNCGAIMRKEEPKNE